MVYTDFRALSSLPLGEAYFHIFHKDYYSALILGGKEGKEMIN